MRVEYRRRVTTSRKPRGPYRKSIERRERILDAALEAFAELGDRGTSLQEIADRVGVKQPALMYYFSSREELLLAALERRDVLNTEVARSARADESFVAGVRHYMEQPGLIKLYVTLMSAATDPQHRGHEFFVERYSDLTSVVAEGLEARQLEARARGDVAAEDMARLLMAVLDGLQVQWLFDPTLDLARLAEVFMRLCAGPEVPGSEPRAGETAGETGSAG
ncbi:TetR/AcrR family transcriptional regulator [Streptomyces sp. NPDC005921]|uniref:TetR/AcrR family transcriptional regulator n=1 Tax=Streptomyces sp. NPDC005827 TaxID=3157070 RepID=UPI0033FE8AA9